MSKESHIVDQIFMDLAPEERMDIARAVGIRDTTFLQETISGGYSFKDLRDWIAPYRSAIVPLLLRKRALLNSEILQMYYDGDLELVTLPLGVGPSIKVRITLPEKTQSDVEDISFNGHYSLTDLVAATALMGEMFIAVGSANVLGSDMPYTPPFVELKSGSVEFGFGGGSLFASGIALIVACTGGMAGVPITIGMAGGVLVAGVGMVDLAIDWKKKIAETRRIEEETGQIVARDFRTDEPIYDNYSLRLLNVKAKEIELEKERVRLEMARNERPPATSDSVPREVVQEQAELYGLSEAYANHILNRTLRVYFLLRARFANIRTGIGDEELD